MSTIQSEIDLLQIDPEFYNYPGTLDEERVERALSRLGVPVKRASGQVLCGIRGRYFPLVLTSDAELAHLALARLKKPIGPEASVRHWTVAYDLAGELFESNQSAISSIAVEAFVAGCWFVRWDPKGIIWSPKPVLQKDSEGRLHCETGPALKSDAGDLYYIHGVEVPRNVVLNPNSITLQRINRCLNQEVRTILINRYKSGIIDYVKDSGGKRVDHDEVHGTLWSMRDPNPVFWMEREINVLEVVNSTPEPDGTHKHYFLRVPPNVQTAHEARAWTFRMTPAEFAPLKET